MSYIITPDFKTLIQTDNLTAITGGNSGVVDQAIAAAQTEVTSYLVQKYDLSRELMDLPPWIMATAYKALERVYLDGDAFSITATYSAQDIVSYQNKVYIATDSIPAGAFNASDWDLLGIQYAKFFVTLPEPEFNFESVYKRDDLVWWKNKVYTCKVPTVIPSHTTDINYPSYNDIPSSNVAPDDPVNGLRYWGEGEPYSVDAGTVPTNDEFWTAGDSRNPQLVNTMVDVVLYTLHSRIAPRNIPDLRVKRYDDAIKWLKNSAVGLNITLAVEKKQPKQGGRIRWGSQVRSNYNF